MATSAGASMPILVLPPLTSTTVMVMFPPMTTFSPGFLLNTSMGFLHELNDLLNVRNTKKNG